MGDRSNIIVYTNETRNPSEKVVIYSHWDGPDLILKLKKALERRKRWDDESYLTRIIVDEVIGGDQGEETGYGITGGSRCDNEYPYVHVHTRTQKVEVTRDFDGEKVVEGGSIPFDIFINQEDEFLLDLMKENSPSD